jgi:tetratricopeptide (TPR) repeat protein
MFSSWGSSIAGLGLFGALSILTFALLTFAQGPDPQQLFQEALEAQQRGDAALAVSKYQQLIELHPDIVAAHANLGVVLASLGRYDEAITQYHIALAEAPGDPGLRLDLGLAYYKKGDFAGAAAQFAALHKDDPANVRVTILLGNCQVQLGLIGQAIALLEPLEKANPDNLDLEWALGLALIGSGDTREGLERVQKVADQRQSVEAYQLAANLYLGLTYFDKARRDAEAVIRLNPHLPKAYVVLGMVDDYSGDEKGAEEEFEKALQIDPHDLQARVQLGSVFCNERKLDAARQQLDRALAQDPNLYSALYLLGRVERAQGNLQAAVKGFESAERENPQWLLPHIELTALYYLLKRPADGAREKTIVDQLRAEERQRHAETRIILPQVPSP